jgi:short-subunit dehydrogenase
LRRQAKTIIITGASAGLGRALALLYAGEGSTLALMGRNAARLESTADACRASGAVVETLACDLCEGQAAHDFIAGFAATRAVDLMIVNAGVFSGHHPDGEMEDAAEATQMLRTNLEAAVRNIMAVVPQMRAQRRGRIAIIGSLAALHPLADAPAYSASKAGLMAYGEALREGLLADGVGVSLVYPGHIATDQTARHVGALPLMASAEAAAALIKKGLDRGQSVIAFPRRLLWLIRGGRLLPWRVRAFLGRSQRFSVLRQG